MPASRPRATSGLTLLEVLAAFLIFSIVFTVLIGTSQTAVHYQGLALRQLEASLVADAVLADIEVQIQQRRTPLIEASPENEIFDVTVTASNVVAEGSAPGGQAAPTPGAASLAGAGNGAAMLAATLPEAARFLRRYDVEVAWMESEGPQSVRRSTFAFDWETASVELADLFGGSTLGGGSETAQAGGDAGQEGDGSASGSGGGRGRGDRRSGNTGSGDLTIEQMRQMVEDAQNRAR